jgi:hypothetical protein
MKGRSLARRDAAFSLVEVTIALGIASFCLLVVFGLLPIGMTTNRDSIEQSTAASLSSSIVADLRGTPNSGAASTSPRYGVSFPAVGGSPQNTSIFLNADGSTNSLTGAGSPPFFRATVTIGAPAAGRVASTGRVWITWPALADQNPGALPSHYSGSFITVVGIDRN